MIFSALHAFPNHPRTVSEADNARPFGVALPWFETLSYFRVDSEPISGDGIRTECFVPFAHASAALGAVRSLAGAPIVTYLRTVTGDRLWLVIDSG